MKQHRMRNLPAQMRSGIQRLQVHKISNNVHCAGVSLNWTRQPEVGDEIIITEPIEWEPSLIAGTKATIRK